VKAYISKRATRAADRIDAHWREHGEDPGLFARELLEPIELLESALVPGARFLPQDIPG